MSMMDFISLGSLWAGVTLMILGAACFVYFRAERRDEGPLPDNVIDLPVSDPAGKRAREAKALQNSTI